MNRIKAGDRVSTKYDLNDGHGGVILLDENRPGTVARVRRSGVAVVRLPDATQVLIHADYLYKC